MKQQEIKAKIAEMISKGTSKSELFSSLSGQGVGDRVLAYLIASHVDPQRCHANRGRIRIMIGVAWGQMILGCLIGASAVIRTPTPASLVFAAILTLIGIVFVIGFSKNSASAYTATMLMTIAQVPNQLNALGRAPIFAGVSLAIAMALYFYVSDLRRRLFPDFAFIFPRKRNGRYVFVD